jgi:hypothetical protein
MKFHKTIFNKPTRYFHLGLTIDWMGSAEQHAWLSCYLVKVADFDGMDNFDFDWDSPWGFSVTTPACPDLGFGVEVRNCMFHR